MNKYLVFILLFLFLVGCSAPAPHPIKVSISEKKINYLKDVKPILDKRCVSCHSCYNSPCQTKLSSFEGVDRGASKLLVYDAMRLEAKEPTRLFIDAQTTQQWRQRDFYSITDSFDANTTHNDSIMLHLLHDKKINPEVVGSYKPESDELICPRDKKELGEYFEDKPNHGMPYGFPAIKDSEYHTLAQWLAQGAHGPTSKEQKEITTPSKKAQLEIQKWEDFFNTKDAKHSVTARYLYEHLFLAHWHFKAAPGEFFELVRSLTPSPQKIEVIASVRPFDNPKTDKFYYRLQKIHSTIVHKTHMVVEFDDAKLSRIKEQFIDTKWIEKPHYIDYDTKTSANPFVAFFQIPAKSRYQFLLDNSHYIVMTFIRGPVCRGQMALNVIHDHFWVMFKDPEHDISIQNPGFLLLQADNLSMPIETTSKSLIETFTDKYRMKYVDYYEAKQKLYKKLSPDGVGIDSIWRGNRASDAPLLTVYRHFDSASVHRGVLGEIPRTMWVIDYPQFERIYYSLVAGYDVFGNISHQTNIRRYMDFLRLEGEFNFLKFMPEDKQLEIVKSWYIGDDMIQNLESNVLSGMHNQMNYKTDNPKNEFIQKVVNEHILDSTGIKFDSINFVHNKEIQPQMPHEFKTTEDIKTGIKALKATGTEFLKHVTEGDVNTMLLRIIMPDGKSKVYTFVVNRWHDNVNSLFGEESRLKPEKDTFDVLPFSVGSYPNSFAVVNYKDLGDFFNIIKNFDASKKCQERFSKYFIRRNNPQFWENFDWFQNHFNNLDPIQSGLYDLNRYYHQ